MKHSPPFRLAAVASIAAVLATSVVATSAALANTPQADGAQVVGPLVTETSPFQGSATFSAPVASAGGGDLAANRAATLAGARQKAEPWFLPAPGARATVRPVAFPDLCLTAATTSAGINSRVTLETCVENAPTQQFAQASNAGSNNPIGTGLRSEHNGGFLGLYNHDAVMRLQTKEIGDRIPTIGDFIPAFSAIVDRIDVAARTAHISGRGAPEAQVVVNGAPSVPIRSDGTWSTTVSDLALGANTIALEQHEDSQVTGRAELTATLAAQALTFTTTFAPERDSAVRAAGTAHPGSTVKLFTPDGTQTGSSVIANPSTGTWQASLPAPNAAGTYDVTAAQFLAGLRDSDHDVTRSVDYGAAVTVSTPDDGAPHAPGRLAMEGNGEQGSAIEVREVTGGTDRLVGRSADGVLPNGRWSLTTDELNRAEHVLRVIQKSRGANTTTAEVTVNPGETGRLAPVVVEAPTTVTPGLTNSFRGTAEPGATYEVLNVSNTPIVPGTLTVADDGQWSFERVVSMTATQFQFKIRQTKDGQTETSDLFTLAANQGVTPIVVTTDAVIPGRVNTFEGTGPANATFTVLNASGSEIVEGDHKIDADGNWTFDRAVSTGALSFSFKLRLTVDKSTYTSKLFELPAATR